MESVTARAGGKGPGLRNNINCRLYPAVDQEFPDSKVILSRSAVGWTLILKNGFEGAPSSYEACFA